MLNGVGDNVKVLKVANDYKPPDDVILMQEYDYMPSLNIEFAYHDNDTIHELFEKGIIESKKNKY